MQNGGEGWRAGPGFLFASWVWMCFLREAVGFLLCFRFYQRQSSPGGPRSDPGPCSTAHCPPARAPVASPQTAVIIPAPGGRPARRPQSGPQRVTEGGGVWFPKDWALGLKLPSEDPTLVRSRPTLTSEVEKGRKSPERDQRGSSPSRDSNPRTPPRPIRTRLQPGPRDRKLSEASGHLPESRAANEHTVAKRPSARRGRGGQRDSVRAASGRAAGRASRDRVSRSSPASCAASPRAATGWPGRFDGVRLRGAGRRRQGATAARASGLSSPVGLGRGRTDLALSR